MGRMSAAQSTARCTRATCVVPAAYAWVAGFALIHVAAITANGRYGAGVDPGTGDSGLMCVLPNVVVIAICLVAAAVIHRTTGPPRPLVPAWTVFAGAWVGMPLLVLRGAATAVDEALRLTGVMRYGLFDQHDDATSAWAVWSGRGIDAYFIVGAVVLAMALGPQMRTSRRQEACPPPRHGPSSVKDSEPERPKRTHHQDGTP